MRIVWGLATSCILIGLVLAIRALFGKYISKRIQYALWLLVAIKLIIFPIPWVESSLAIFDGGAEVSFFEKEELYPSLEASVIAVQTQTVEYIANSKPGQVTPFSKEPQVNENVGTAQNEQIYETSQPAQPAEQANDVLPPKAQSGFNWLILIVVAEVSGAAAAIIYMAYYNLKFRKYLIDNRVSVDVSNTLFENGREVTIPVYSVEGLPSPCLFGNAIYVSDSIVEEKDKLRHVLAHEYSHYRHGDQIWAVVRCICFALYFWNPLCIIGAYVSKQDCELACDESALLLLGESERISYGRTLIGMIAIKSSVRDGMMIATTMSASKKGLKNRVIQISKKQKNIISVCVAAVAFLLVTLIVTSSVKAEENANLIRYDGEKIVYESYDEVLSDSKQYAGFTYLPVVGCDTSGCRREY